MKGFGRRCCNRKNGGHDFIFAISLMKLLILLKQYTDQTVQLISDGKIWRIVVSAVGSDELKTVATKSRQDAISLPKGKAFIQI